MYRNRVVRIYEILLVSFSIVLITVVVHITLPFQPYRLVYYALIFVWTFFLSATILTLYRKDIEIDTRLHVVRFAYLSATLVQELRKAEASILKSRSLADVEDRKNLGIRVVLNLAHEYYSFIKNEHCTADIALITELPGGERVCKIVQYDDFVPNARRRKEVEVPLKGSLFGEIVKRDIRAITIDDYTLDNYPIYRTPIIDEGYCLSGICVPIKVFDEVVAFFNIDSMKRNVFKPAEDERIAAFFAELTGQLFQVVDCKLEAFGQNNQLPRAEHS